MGGKIPPQRRSRRIVKSSEPCMTWRAKMRCDRRVSRPSTCHVLFQGLGHSRQSGTQQDPPSALRVGGDCKILLIYGQVGFAQIFVLHPVGHCQQQGPMVSRNTPLSTSHHTHHTAQRGLLNSVNQRCGRSSCNISRRCCSKDSSKACPWRCSGDAGQADVL